MVKIIVVGCLHGELDQMYEDVKQIEKDKQIKIDIILCCGDFQAVRNKSDLTVMSVPAKFRRIGDFYKYYSGEKVAPFLTVFVGGNHEASNYLQELPYGGWVAEKIYYMGYAGVINYLGLRIGGLSGIYKRHDFFTGHFEHAPYDDQSKRTAYHVRSIDTFRLQQLRRGLDVVLSHDWPRGVHRYGNEAALARKKPHFADEMAANDLGSPAAEDVLVRLRPRYWLAAHLHVKFVAKIEFTEPEKSITRFLALDKCLPRREYLQLLDIEPNPESPGLGVGEPDKLFLDPEWLCVLRATNHLMSISRSTNILPDVIEGSCNKQDFSASKEDMKEMRELFKNKLAVPDNFQQTAPVHNELQDNARQAPVIHMNPQTNLICVMVELVNPNAEFLGIPCGLEQLNKANEEEEEAGDNDEDDDSSCNGEDDNPEEIQLDEDEQDSDDDANAYKPMSIPENPEEIQLNDSSDDNDESSYKPMPISYSPAESIPNKAQGDEKESYEPMATKDNAEEIQLNESSGDDEKSYKPDISNSVDEVGASEPSGNEYNPAEYEISSGTVSNAIEYRPDFPTI